MALDLHSLDGSLSSSSPLEVEEIIRLMRQKWGVAYDLRLVVRNERLFLQIMWGYLEQKSFPLNEDEYKLHINEILEILNRTGQARNFREWIFNIVSKPRLGRALTLPINSDQRLDEFVL
tara:strand:+ start:39 stop:398 length:360 start_codon:yes stop_codon:yes gene_type:complete